MKAAQEHVEARDHLSVRAGAMPAIFSESRPGSGPALRLAAQLQINPVNFPRIVLAAVKKPRLLSNAKTGTRGR